MKSTSSERLTSVQWRQSRVNVRARAVAPETKIMFKWSSFDFPARAPRGNWQHFGKTSMRRLHQIIHGESAMAELLQRRSRELALEQHVKKALPRTLANCVSVADGRSSELTLSATSGAAAALLRQRAPELRRVLAGEGCEFTGMRVRVQARTSAFVHANPAKKQLDSVVAAQLLATAQRLGDSPVAAALRRLARRATPPSQGDEDAPQRVEN